MPPRPKRGQAALKAEEEEAKEVIEDKEVDDESGEDSDDGDDGDMSDLDEENFAEDDDEDEEDGEEGDYDEDEDEDEDEEEEVEGEGDDDEEDDEDDDEEEEEEEEEDEPSERPAHDLWDDEEEQAVKPRKTEKSKARQMKLVGGGSLFPGKYSRGDASAALVDDPNNQNIGEISAGEDSEEDGPLHRNPVGDIPMEWYKDEKHIGYDLSGKKIIRKPRKDTLDQHLAKADDPQSWRNVYDEVNDEELRLTDDELKLLRRLRKGKFAPGYDAYADYPTPVDDPEHKIHPLFSRPEPKSRFVPSKHEAKMVVKYVRMIRAGTFKRPPEKAPDPTEMYSFDLWDKEDDIKWRGAVPIAAPKQRPPGHAESYNPPQEYLLTKEEEETMLSKKYEDRAMNFVPRQYTALRKVPLYGRILHERFERCLDLYLCPRAVKKRMNVDPETLLPKLPSPKDLRPFPTTLSVQFLGHKGRVNCISVQSGPGVFMASGGEDGTVRVWEVATGRCLRTYKTGKPVVSVAWNPNPELDVIAAASGQDVVFIDPRVGGGEESLVEGLIMKGKESGGAGGEEGGKKDLCQWVDGRAAEAGVGGVVLTIKHIKPVKGVSWHYKGDYVVTLAPTANTKAILIHQLSKRATQNPFAKSKADSIKVVFHPSKPFLFVGTRKHVKVYNLLKQSLAKKLIGGFKYMSSFEIHPGGDNVVCTAIDRRISWFDMDLSTKPYKTMRYDDTGLSSVSFHPKYPLFATGGVDGNAYVFHGMVYSDLLQNPLIVPVKKIHAHKSDGTEGVTSVMFHPSQPWLFTCGMDSKIQLFTELN